MAHSPIIFITGGVRSGKSHFAEQQAHTIAKKQGRNLVYLATAVSFDVEMTARIERHKLERKDDGWRTIEQSSQLPTLAKKLQDCDLVLWDCVTTWLTNELYVRASDSASVAWQNPHHFAGMIERTKHFIMLLQSRQIPLVIVSNEVLDERISRSREVLFFQQQLGQFHQWLVALSTQAIEMDYSLPYYWKKDGDVL
ncbi:bifunctional adenosylcobinamide kinase/adenosylcobinamide-phosphate guanylyltransferase [Kurthia sibirica]|uniref:Adenosylcobinamide kinase n=1 Tax=Kurthia sibirica TaxID=202750 RepID=A0A2U3AKV7_9BACL|nr:bifunctional adenosylcobinamide kinase/adenosylcobinamide-phosphate guanylyltransferase [Kurthia sibirica]PWI25141.1 cobinamide kinase [Kurthia sibirica]GEK33225.1 hypothetical protein KSI01_07580 [Kurthia sibirica]